MRLICGLLVGHVVRTRAALETRRGTHAVGQVCNEVGNLDATGFEFTVQPVHEGQHAGPLIARHDAHHLVNVFC